MHYEPNAVRWGIIGTANIARAKIVPALQASPWCDAWAVGSRTLAAAETFARGFGIPKAYGSYEAVLEDPDVEAVYIPLPNHLHIEIALAAASRGKHVLCEKPVALTADEAERLRDIPEGILVAEAFMVRHHPQWEALRARLRSGEHGTVCAVQALLSCTLNNPDDFRFNPDFGGGALYDVGSYAAMTARFVFESEPERVFCALVRDPGKGTDYLCSAILDFGQGRHASFTVGLKMAAAQRLLVICEKSTLELPAPYITTTGAPAEIVIDSCTGLEDSAPQRFTLPDAEQYECEVTHFAKAVRGQQPLPFGIGNERPMASGLILKQD